MLFRSMSYDLGEPNNRGGFGARLTLFLNITDPAFGQLAVGDSVYVFFQDTAHWTNGETHFPSTSISTAQSPGFLRTSVSITADLPERYVGVPIELTWSVGVNQNQAGFIDLGHTADLGITLPIGFTFTPQSPEFLSQQSVPVPPALPLLGSALLLIRRYRRKT